MNLNENIEQLKKGSVKAKERLYKSFYGYVKGIVLRYVSNTFDVEEIVNDCFIKIFNSIDGFYCQDQQLLSVKFKGWIGRLSANKSIDFIRSRKKIFVEEAIENFSHQYTTTEIVGSINAENILYMLQQLPEIYRVIFNLFEIEGYSHDEIAKMLHIPSSTSRSYLRRAKLKLKEMYLKQP